MSNRIKALEKETRTYQAQSTELSHSKSHPQFSLPDTTNLPIVIELKKEVDFWKVLQNKKGSMCIKSRTICKNLCYQSLLELRRRNKKSILILFQDAARKARDTQTELEKVKFALEQSDAKLQQSLQSDSALKIQENKLQISALRSMCIFVCSLAQF